LKHTVPPLDGRDAGKTKVKEMVMGKEAQQRDDNTRNAVLYKAACGDLSDMLCRRVRMYVFQRACAVHHSLLSAERALKGSRLAKFEALPWDEHRSDWPRTRTVSAYVVCEGKKNGFVCVWIMGGGRERGGGGGERVRERERRR
jgi:hypothetical protein